MRSGTPLTQLVEFSYGFPDGDVSWELLDGTGTSVANGVVTPEAGSASAVVSLTSNQNSITNSALSSPRELHWFYTVGGILYEDRRRYTLEAFLPLGVSETGVRAKLGVEPDELEDEKINLVSAYLRFQDKVTKAKLDAVTDLAALQARDGIEALAALDVLPTLQVYLAAKESSGTNQFQRTSIDWDKLRAALEAKVSEGYTAVDPLLDETAAFGALFVTVVMNDPVTGQDQ